jgi:tripartite-type tricarboxylate transporter receptor subunit TctC
VVQTTILFAATTLALALLPAAPAQAQGDYPNKSVLLVICFGAGGGLDVIGRIVADRLGKNLGRQIIVENRPGAGGNIGMASVVKAPADGYTLLETTNSYNINPFIYRNPGYDPRRDFVPVVELTRAPSVIIVHPKSTMRTVSDLIAAARAAPGKLVYGSAGNGSPTNIAMEIFKVAAGVDITHVPYKVATQANQDVMGGQTPLAMAALPSVITQIRGGLLHMVAVTADKRWPSLPDVPTAAEAGVAGYSHLTWIGIVAPVGTRPAIVARLNREIAAVLVVPEVRERIVATGAEPVGNSAADFAAVLTAEYEGTARLAQRVKFQME